MISSLTTTMNSRLLPPSESTSALLKCIRFLRLLICSVQWLNAAHAEATEQQMIHHILALKASADLPTWNLKRGNAQDAAPSAKDLALHMKKRKLYRQATGCEEVWFPYDNASDLVKELVWESGGGELV